MQTRYIGYDPELMTRQSMNFRHIICACDLHAHVINIMFVLTVLAIMHLAV